MYSVKGTTIKLTRGDTLVVKLTLTKDGEAYELAEGDTVLFAVKSRLNPGNTAYVERDPLISKAIDTETMTLKLNPEDTSGLPFGRYVYDIQVTFADGAVDTVINNATIEIMPEVA